LTEADRLAIHNLAHDIPALWQADTTTAIDRQMIVRQLEMAVKIRLYPDAKPNCPSQE
jgi:hypothetical protein